MRGRVVLGQPAGQRGPQVERDAAEVAPLGVGLVALGVDAGVPVAVRRRARLRRDLAAERVAPLRLVEVAVNGQLGTAHPAMVAETSRRRPSGSGFLGRAVDRLRRPRKRIVRVVLSPGASETGQRNRSELPW